MVLVVVAEGGAGKRNKNEEVHYRHFLHLIHLVVVGGDDTFLHPCF